MSTWFITGASRGFGRAIAAEALANGDSVVASARDGETVRDALPDVGDRLMVASLDVTDPDSVGPVVDAAVTRFGTIDVLVNNAGRGMLGAVEEVSDAEARTVFDLNVFGVLTVLRAVLPVMREQRSGHVITMSSMGGFAQPGSGWGIYGGSKFAVEGISEALRNEVAPLGITVTIVEPGGFRTDFLDASSLHVSDRVIDDYAQTSGRTRTGADDRNHLQVGDPARLARAIVAIGGLADPPFRLPLGPDALAALDNKISAVVDGLTPELRELALSTSFDES